MTEGNTKLCEEAAMRKTARGFTLVELLVTVAFFAIFSMISMPLFTSVYQGYRFDGAAQTVGSDLRYAQGLAVNKGGCYGLHFGSDPLVNRPNQYRIEKGGCNGLGWPAAADTMATNPNVITNWYNLPQDFPGVTITSLKDNASLTVNRVSFNSLGASVNPFVAISNPVTITLSNASGATRAIQVRATGSVQVP